MKKVLHAALWMAALIATTASAQPVRIAGSGANVGAITLLIAEFRKLEPGAQFAAVEAVGSEGAVKAAAAGALHIALTSRPITDGERALGVREIEYARTPFVIAVRSDSKIESITGAKFAHYLESTAESGPDGVRVRPVLRPARDVDISLLKRLSAAAAPALDEALKRPGMMIATTDKEAADLIERTPGAIGATTLGLILAESRRLRALPFEGATPTLAAFESGAYPYYKRLFLVVSEKTPPSAEAKRFAEYVTSPAGKALLQRTGHLLPPFSGA